MFKVYASPDEVHVRATYIYKKNNDTKAYADGNYSRQLGTSELKDIFIKGAVIQASNALYKPVSLKITAGVATITYVTADATTATTAVLATLTSRADA